MIIRKVFASVIIESVIIASVIIASVMIQFLFQSLQFLFLDVENKPLTDTNASSLRNQRSFSRMKIIRTN